MSMHRPWKSLASALALGGVVAATLALAPPAASQSGSAVVTWFLGFNTTIPPFSDVLVRRAVATAIDRSQLAAAGNYRLATSLEPPGCIGHNPVARLHPYNPQLAKDLLTQSGIKPDEYGELGLWVISVLTRADVRKRELEILTANLRSLGLLVTVREFGNYDAFDRIAILPVVRMSYWGVRWTGAGCAQGTFLETLVHSKGEFNRFGYRNSEVDSLLDRARSASDRLTRTRLYNEAEQRVLDEAVIVPVWWDIR